MSSQPGADRPSGRSPRRAVRRSGTVGTDDAALVSTLPAFPTDDPSPPAAVLPGAPADPVSPATAVRSADDSDVGWGGGGDTNDDRLHQDKPPHW
ncbi:hypothetical protein [Cellulomonas sp. URHB0016]